MTKTKYKHSREEAGQMRDIIVEALEDGKAQDISVLDVHKLTEVMDYMVVATGGSDRHVKALSDRVAEAMNAKSYKEMGIEGERDRDWILLDFVDVVVHVMRQQAREKYDLEGLWDQTFDRFQNQEAQEIKH